MSNTFFISDTHFGHENSLNWKDPQGNPLRPFSSAEEMDSAMVENWNSVVSTNDKVYHLGDVVIKKPSLGVLSHLNGQKVLVMGNHDIFGHKEYLKYFKSIYGVRVFDDMVLSHVPLHPGSVQRFKFNVHGHLHSNKVDDYRYFNVSVERIGFTPIAVEDLRLRLKVQKNTHEAEVESQLEALKALGERVSRASIGGFS